MVLQGYKVTSAKAANGELVCQNGTPYNVARIIEFLPPHTTPKKGSRVTPSSETMVRLSLYYRPSDISARNISDFRLLLAAIHTDIQPLSNVRGKCYVRHKDRIDDLLKWKKLPDHFYFHKFFDPYIKREFEVIRTESANNIPPDVKQALMSRYEYLVTEREMVADLTDAFRSCCMCSQWASSQESVRCESCKKHYHMSCVKPPLAGKPAKGYSWVCPPCSFQRHKDVEEHKFLFTQNGSAPSKAKSAAKAKEKAAATDGRPDVSFRGWPWRYFGLYTRAEDALDPEDAIFPRAATRVGQKYQANVPTWEEEQERSGIGHVETEAGPSRHAPVIPIERGHDPDERKHESTIELKSQPSDELNAFMEEVAAMKLAVPSYDVERLNMAIASYTTMGREKALKYMRSTRLSSFRPIIFNDQETATFAAELSRNGGLEVHETAKILNRTPAEVLRFSYIWNNRRLAAENEALRQHQRVNTHHARHTKTLGAPTLGKIRPGSKDDADHSDDEVSMYNASFTSSNKMVCAACSTKISEVWWRCPRTVSGIAMCENCGSNYRKYGVIAFTKSDDSKKAEKKDAALKKGKGEASGTSTPVPPPPPKLPPCAVCRRMEPKPMMARCKTCTFSVHAGCYGIPSQDMGPTWECELCVNARLEENHLEPRCVLCPRDFTAVLTKHKRKPNVDFDLLSALKPTEGRRWAHILCSAWQGEVKYDDPARLKTVEGVMEVAREKWEATCTLCNQIDGAVIRCTDCEAVFHPSCAWLSGYKIGFEFSLAKPGRHQTITVAKFKDSEGVMGPGCWCKGHDLEGRVIYDLHEIDPEQNETALQIYAAAYKPISHDSFATLRKATRLESFLPHTSTIFEQQGENQKKRALPKECEDCGIDVSPIWHEVDDVTEIKEERMDVDGQAQEQGQGQESGTAKKKRKRLVCQLCYFNTKYA
nr:uncharacterized protein CI109_002716 [Kwoniella shandongensis]KAA5528959.1 hypothetical protein CI109_002716 [Kwoniella shandongensis]